MCIYICICIYYDVVYAWSGWSGLTTIITILGIFAPAACRLKLAYRVRALVSFPAVARSVFLFGEILFARTSCAVLPWQCTPRVRPSVLVRCIVGSPARV